MAEIKLEPRALLGGYDREFGTIRLTEVTDLAIVSMATPQGDEAKCADAVQSAWSCQLPAVGRYVTSADGKLRLVGTAPDQLFALFEHQKPDALRVVDKAVKNAFWTTDQSDVWCALAISGKDAPEALARICPLDLHPDVFGQDAASRTVMEHLGTMILRTGEDSFLLLSARSSAQSFLHAVELSIKNIL